jgi:hypothetical protein
MNTVVNMKGTISWDVVWRGLEDGTTGLGFLYILCSFVR